MYSLTSTREEFNHSVNGNNATELGAKEMKEFQEGLLGTFRKPSTTKVVLKTSTKNKRAKRKVDKDEYNPDLLLGPAFLFLGTYQIESNQVLSCELAPVPISLF